MHGGSSSHSRRMIGLSLVSALLAWGVASLHRANLIPTSLRPVAALVPVLPLIWFFIGISRWLRSLDELQRMIHLEAMAIQFSATCMLVMSYGMLARFAIVPNLTASQAYPLLWLAIFGFWTIGFVVVRRKYQ